MDTKNRFSPMRIIFLSYVFAILIGGSLLYMPSSQMQNVMPLSFLDCIFTATSALCVTGLVVAPTSVQWSGIGQVIIIFLIQIGGLGVITIRSFIYIIIGKKLNFEDRLLIQSSLNQDKVGGIVKMTRFIITATFLFEFIGALLLGLYFFFIEHRSLHISIYYGIFHSISAFCNGGFDLLGINSLSDYSSSWYISIVIGLLIFTGGIGFFVWQDICIKIKNREHKLELSSYLALTTSFILILVGAVYFFFAEYTNPETIGGFSINHKIISSLFQSVTLRTAGFFSIDQFALREPSKFLSSILMLIGGSPGSIAGGIKTVTIAVIFLSVWNIIRGREGVNIKERRIPIKTLQKSLALTFIYMLLAFSFAMVLSVTEVDSAFIHTFSDLFYECCSALATVGLTTGITPYLSIIGKLLIIISMFIGRVGPLTVVHSFATPHNNDAIKYPKKDVLIG